MMFTIASIFDFSFLKVNWGSPILVAAVLIVLVCVLVKLYSDSKKKEDDPDSPAEAAASRKPGPKNDLNDSLRNLANVVNFLGVTDGAVILSDLAAGDYSNAPRAARALATKLDTPDGRKELIKRIIDKHAASFVDDPAIVSRFASVMAKAKR